MTGQLSASSGDLGLIKPFCLCVSVSGVALAVRPRPCVYVCVCVCVRERERERERKRDPCVGLLLLCVPLRVFARLWVCWHLHASMHVSGWLSVREYNFASALSTPVRRVCDSGCACSRAGDCLWVCRAFFSLPRLRCRPPPPTPPSPALSGLSSLMKQSSPSILLIANPFLLFVGAEPFSGTLTAQLV